MVGNTAPKRWRIAVDTLAVITVIALMLSSWALYTRFSDSNHIRTDNKRVWHAVVCSIEQAVVKNETLSFKDRQKAIAFYDGLLINDVQTRGCGYRITRR